jgi:hypothetical protein
MPESFSRPAGEHGDTHPGERSFANVADDETAPQPRHKSSNSPSVFRFGDTHPGGVWGDAVIRVLLRVADECDEARAEADDLWRLNQSLAASHYFDDLAKARADLTQALDQRESARRERGDAENRAETAEREEALARARVAELEALLTEAVEYPGASTPVGWSRRARAALASSDTKDER